MPKGNRDYTNSGILFANHDKRSEKSPDLTGNINVNGTEYDLAAWRRTGKKGEFLSLRIKGGEERRQSAEAEPATDSPRAPEPTPEPPKDELGQPEMPF